ncbi:MAG: hypothetical protein IMW98_10110 [Firmicutes bacterium]|nr:hypothetical protein [Bacillota bacterium]
MDRHAGGRRAPPAFLLPAAAVLAAALVLAGLSAAAADADGAGGHPQGPASPGVVAAKAGSLPSAGGSVADGRPRLIGTVERDPALPGSPTVYLAQADLPGGWAVMGEATSERRAEDLAALGARSLPEALAYAGAATGVPLSPRVDVTLTEHALYQAEAARYLGPALAASSAGYVHGLPAEPMVEVDADAAGGGLTPLLAHELMHAVLLRDGLDRSLPLWANEALAVEAQARALCGSSGSGCQVWSALGGLVIGAGLERRPPSSYVAALADPAEYDALRSRSVVSEEWVGWLALRWLAAHSPAGRLDAPGFLAAVRADGYAAAFRESFGVGERAGLAEVTAWVRRAETGGGWDPRAFMPAVPGAGGQAAAPAARSPAA